MKALLSLLLVSSCSILLAFSGSPAQSHDIYGSWKDNKGASCCNNRDCRPAKTRVNGEAVEVLIEGEWVPVPPDKYIRVVVPDMQDHICHIPGTKQILCFAPGGGV